MPSRLSSVLVLLLFAARVHAQPAALPQPSKPVKAAGADAAYSVEQLHNRVRFESDGTGRREMTLWVRVLDEQAVRQWGQIPLFYQSDTETLALEHVEVQKPDGSVVATPVETIPDVAVQPSANIPIFLDVHEKQITVSAVRPGDLVKVQAVWTTNRPVAPGQFWFDHTFDTAETVRDEQLEINVPADRIVAVKDRSGSPVEEHGGAGAVSGDRRIYVWKTSNAHAPTEPPPHQPGTDEAPPDVRMSSFRNWEEFAGWFGTLTSGPPDATVKAKAAALIAGATDDAAKIAAIYHFVSTEIRYVSLSFGLGRFAAHMPSDVLAHQYGDCKDKAVLLQSLLAAAGVPSVRVALNTTRSIDGDFASPLEFNHMVALVPGKSDPADGTWMDGTLEVAPLGMMGASTRGKRALLVSGSHASVIRTPLDPPFAAVNEIAVDGAVNAIGTFVGTVTYTLHSDSELDARAVVRTIPRSSLTEFVTSLASAAHIDGDFSEITTSDPATTTEPFRLTLHMRKGGFLDWAAAQSEVAMMPVVPFPYMHDADRKGLDHLFMGSPKTVRLRTTIEFPTGYDISLPPAASVTRAGITYTATYRLDGRRLIAERVIAGTMRDLPAAQFGEYSALADAAIADLTQHLKIRSTITTTPPIPDGATADELYHAAYAAYMAKRYEPAAALWKKTTEMDPKMGSAWDSLGLAYEELKKYDEAAAAIQKQIDLDPYDKRAYKDLGEVLKKAGKKSDAARAYAKHIELNPLDGEALKDLGYLYSDENRYAEAAPLLEKASTLNKPDGWMFTELGTAYLHIKEQDKARHAFDRALELSPTTTVWTKIAWQLAEANVDLDRADDLARRSEKQIAEETQHLELASVTPDQLDLVGRLAWTWDAIGWVQFQRGNLTEAERYVRAAWRLGADADTAFHLGQIYEKEEYHLADALSCYLTAQALSSYPTAEMESRVKHLSGGGDLPAMLDGARMAMTVERTTRISQTAPGGRIQFLALIGNDGTVTSTRFLKGSESLRSLEPVVRGERYPIEFPSALPIRLALDVGILCIDQKGCMVGVMPPRTVTLDK